MSLKIAALIALVITGVSFNYCFFRMCQEINRVAPPEKHVFIFSLTGPFTIYYRHCKFVPDSCLVRWIALLVLPPLIASSFWFFRL